jgi:DNA-binding CsgD family transcriptional regulator
MDSPIEETDIRAIVRILGHVAAMKPSPDRQRKHLMGALAKLLGSDTWVWGVAPLLEAGKQPVYIYHQTCGFDEERMSRFLMAVEHPDSGVMTAPLAKAVAEAGSQVTRPIQQIVPWKRFTSSPAWPFWQGAGIGPILITIRPVPGYGISCIGFYRPVDARAFGEREARIAHIVLSEVPLLHEAGMPHAAARTLPQLPPRCRLIINQLVRGMSRHDIAAHLGLSPHTVHDYVKRIFQHFSVHSQSELIARLTCGDGMDR